MKILFLLGFRVIIEFFGKDDQGSGIQDWMFGINPLFLLFRSQNAIHKCLPDDKF